MIAAAAGLLATTAGSAAVGGQYPAPMTFSTLAGNIGYGATDGTGSNARFFVPFGVAADATGNIYVADQGNNIIRKVSPAGVVTTLAGTAGMAGATDSVDGAPLFNVPLGVAVDGAGNVYVADQGNSTIRKITPAGSVTTLAGHAGQAGATDSAGGAPLFNAPRGVAVDGGGNVYVADFGNNTIRKITPAGVVTTMAGQAGVGGSVDATGGAARFYGPSGVAVDGGGNVYVADWGNSTIRKITPAGVVTTLAGQVGVANPSVNNVGSADGSGSAARFNGPTSVTVDQSGVLYVADRGNNTIRKITAAGAVTTLAGTAGATGIADGTGAAARFYNPSGVVVDGTGNIYVADTYNQTLRKIVAGAVTTFAGLPGGAGSTDGTAGAARFSTPSDVAVDGNGTVYVADTMNHTIRKITAAGVVTTLAGTAGQSGALDATGAAARFNQPYGVAVDSHGNVYVADTFNDTIRMITPEGVVSTIAGLPGTAGSSDGTGAAARFNDPYGVAVDGAGNIYVADTSNQLIRKIAPGGVVTTLAGAAGASGSVDGTSQARFYIPFAVTVDGAGNVYVADRGNHIIRKITASGMVTTLAGQVGADPSTNFGSVDGTGSAARFVGPGGVAVDSAGNVYVGDTYNHTIRKITAAGVVTTVAGQAGASGSLDGTGIFARFDYPYGVAVDANGMLYVADTGNQSIRRSVVAPAITSAMTASGTVGQSFSYAIAAANEPTSYAATGLPEGLTIDATSGIISGVPTAAGSFSVTLTASNLAGSGTATLTLTSAKGDQTIAFAPLANRSYGETFALGATATSGLPIVYTVVSGPAAIGGTSVSLTGAGTVTIRASQPGNANYNAAAAVEQSFTVTASGSPYGAYFGTASGGGLWAMFIRSDNTGVFIASLPDRTSVIVQALTVDQSGAFTTTGTEDVLQGTAGTFTLSGQILGGNITGQLTGLSETFTGSLDVASETPVTVPAYYVASAVGTVPGTLHVIVGPSGRSLAVTVLPTLLDGVAGTVGPDGQLTATSTAGTTYSVTINGSQQTISGTVTPPGGTPVQFLGLADGVASTTRLTNVSVRSNAGTGAQTLIMGFVVRGPGSRSVLMRAVGPTLEQLHVDNPLANPKLELFKYDYGQQAFVYNDENDDWGGTSLLQETFSRLGAFALPAQSKDAALLKTLESGPYTVQVSSADGGPSGIVLVEGYDAETGTGTRLMNVSARSQVGVGADILIAGFVIEGNTPKRVLIRGLGPTLLPSVTGALADPQLTLFRYDPILEQSERIAANDNWGGTQALKDVAQLVGAQPLIDDNSKDAVILTTLAPGIYTAQVNGANDTTGVALVEVYDCDGP